MILAVHLFANLIPKHKNRLIKNLEEIISKILIKSKKIFKFSNNSKKKKI